MDPHHPRLARPGRPRLLVVILALATVVVASAPAAIAQPFTRQPSLRLACHSIAADQPVIACHWSPGPEGTRAYQLLRAADGQDGVPIARLGVDAQGYRDHDVEVGVRYTYLLRALDGHGRQLAHSARVRAGIRSHDGQPATAAADRA